MKMLVDDCLLFRLAILSLRLYEFDNGIDQSRYYEMRPPEINNGGKKSPNRRKKKGQSTTWYI